MINEVKYTKDEILDLDVQRRLSLVEDMIINAKHLIETIENNKVAEDCLSELDDFHENKLQELADSFDEDESESA